MKINLDKKHKNAIDSFLLRFPYTYFAYGSRVTGKAKPYSDLDLCIWQDVSIDIFAHIKEGLNNLLLPFSIDLISWPRLSYDFKNNIKNDLIRYILILYWGHKASN